MCCLLCLFAVFIWYSLCFCTSARPCSFTSGPHLSALGMKSHRCDLWPATKPFPQHQADNKHKYLGAHHCRVLVHACTTSHFSVCNFSVLLRVIWFKNVACASTENWRQTEIEHEADPSCQDTAASTSPSFPNVNFWHFFLARAPPTFTRQVKIVGFIGATLSPLTFPDSEVEVIRMSCSHLKSCTCSTTCMRTKAW